MPRKKSEAPAPPKMQAGASIYPEGVGSKRSKKDREALAANQARSVRRIGDSAQGPGGN